MQWIASENSLPYQLFAYMLILFFVNILVGLNVNVAKTYLDMCKEQGLSDREAIRQICESVGLKFASSYSNDWSNFGKTFRAIPPAVVKEMQQRTAIYAARKAGIKTTGDKALLFANMLSPKVKNID